MMSRCLVILATAVLLTTMMTASDLSDGERSEPFQNELQDDDEYNIYEGLKLRTRDIKDADLSFLMENEGVASSEEVYNIRIDGTGTGLKPPTQNEWGYIFNSFNMIDDISFASPAALNASKLHNQSKYFPPIGNQGAEGSCVSWSIGYYTKTWMEAKEHDWNLSGATMGGTWPGQPSAAYQDRIMSPDFLYHQVNNGVDGGSYYSDNIYMCQRTGICSWKNMPYNCYNSTSWPSEAAWREAPLYRSQKNSTYYMYTQTNSSLISLKTWLDGGNLATISINAYRYPDLVSDLWNNTVECGTGRNHANTIIGYDDNHGPYAEDGTTRTGAFLVANSWGKGWSGDSNSDGMYWISYECMRKKVQYVCLMTDMIDYEPEALALFNISHAKREECTITIGIGPKTSPAATKKRYDSMIYDGGPNPFPSNMMAYDITEFGASVSTFIGYNYFIKVDDGGTSTTGSIMDFSIELFDDYGAGPAHRFISTDPVVPTVNGGTVYAELTATDNIPPMFIEDRSPSNATTGDPLNLTVLVVDNGVMDRVTVEYKSGTGPTYNTTMNRGTGNSWFLNISAPDTLQNITYLFHAADTGGNWNSTAGRSIAVLDNDRPEVVTTFPLKATTGDPYLVTANVTDNIAVKTVVIEYWYDDEEHTNRSMTSSGGGNWTTTLMIGDRLGNLSIHIKANDTSDNQERSPLHTVQIEDNDMPMMISDLSDTYLTTGEGFTLSAVITDNIGVSLVFAVYTNNDGFSGNSSMSIIAPDTWGISLTSPHSTADISYSFDFCDTSGSWNNSSSSVVPVEDNDLPYFGEDLSPDTARTGEIYDFSIEVLDNIQVEDVHLEYWFGTGTHQNVTMTGTGPYLHSIIIPDDMSENLSYSIHAVDPSSNWNHTLIAEVLVIDNDLPGSWVDTSANTGTTGDIFIFELDVNDNIGIDSVHVEYWFGSGEHVNATLEQGATFTLDIMIPSNSTEMLHYIFRACDTSDNWNSTMQKDVTIVDDDLPLIGPDTTPGTGYTGEPFSFTFEAGDNIGIGSVHVEYWFGDGQHQNATVEGSGYYYLTIDVPPDSIETLHYILRVSDVSGNWNGTSQGNVEIMDNVVPSLDDATNDTATTGDDFIFRITVLDNLQVESVWLEYWFSSGPHSNVSMEGIWNFTFTIIIPSDSLEELLYIVRSCDGSGNWNRTHVKNVTVIDNDLPVFGTDASETETGTGDLFEISINVTDNIGVSMVSLEYWFGDEGEQMEADMVLNGSFYSVSIEVPIDSTENLYYRITAVDLSGLSNSTGIKEVQVLDDIDPEIDAVEDIVIYVGKELRVTISAADNIGVASYIWEGAPIDVSGPELLMTPSEAGSYEVTVRILDASGNAAEIRFTIIVLPLDHDSDQDGIPDLVEDENGLDREDPTDALEDIDGDGLTNLQEYLNGTKMDDDDTDGDEMPDQWEVMYGLDPLTPSSTNDQDGDGITDLEEYNGGTDPMVKDKPDDEDHDDGTMNFLLPLLILAGIILLIIVAVVIFMLLRRSKKVEPVQEDNEQVMSWD
ncbi:MAG: C1 family peptidase [Candidatus Thermoplasmatota archaeon]|nr:C1 family peptidase [Candidatus Thermoplasmatota archaeon]